MAHSSAAGRVSLWSSSLPLPWHSGRWLLQLACLPVLVYLALPTLIIVPMALSKGDIIQFPPIWASVHSFIDFFDDPQWIQSAIVSFKVAGLAVLMACLSGSSAAIALHGTRLPGTDLLVGLILVPLVVPVVVLGLGDYLFFERLRLAGNWIGIGLAHSVLVSPYVFISVRAGLANLNPALVRSARSLGASDVSVFRHVYWPAIAPSVAAGAIFSFAVSFDEVVIALFLQGPHATTLPVRMFTAIQYELTPKIAAVSSLLLFLATIIFFAHAAFTRHRPVR